MQVTVRRLTVVGTIALCSAVCGVVLGNFVAGSVVRSGADELADYRPITELREGDEEHSRAPRYTQHTGPSSYECDGCDAELYPEVEWMEPADVEPLPPYSVYPPDEELNSPVRAVPSVPAPDTRSTYRDVPDLPPMNPPLLPE